jgi:hypothetical protein
MTKQELIQILERVSPGQNIPGMVTGKSYMFKGFAEYTGKGRYPHLRGTRVIALQSNGRKRPNTALFLEPLLLFVNADPNDLRHGGLPLDYIDQYRSGDPQGIPNLYEFEGSYKSLARYIRGLTAGGESLPK